MENIKLGLIIDGKVYEAVKWTDCKNCALYNRMPYCNEPCGAILDIHDKNLYMFKKVESIESIILKNNKSLDSDISKLVDDNFLI